MWVFESMDTIFIIAGLAILACFVFGPIIYLRTRPEERELNRLHRKLREKIQASRVIEAIILPPSHFILRLLPLLLFLVPFVWLCTTSYWVFGIVPSVSVTFLVMVLIARYLKGRIGIKITEEFLLVNIFGQNDGSRPFAWSNISTFVIVRKRRLLLFPVKRVGLVFEKSLREETRNRQPKQKYGALDYVLSSNLGMSAEELADFLNTRLLRYTRHLS